MNFCAACDLQLTRASMQTFHTAPPALAPPARYDAMEYPTLSHSSQDMLPQHSAMMASQRKAGGGSMGAPQHPAAALPPKSSSRQRGMTDAAAAQAAMVGPPMVGAYGGGMQMHPGPAYGPPQGVRGPPGAGQVLLSPRRPAVCAGCAIALVNVDMHLKRMSRYRRHAWRQRSREHPSLPYFKWYRVCR